MRLYFVQNEAAVRRDFPGAVEELEAYDMAGVVFRVKDRPHLLGFNPNGWETNKASLVWNVNHEGDWYLSAMQEGW